MGANITRWHNMETWLAEGGDYELAERSAYFAEIRYPSCRRFTEGEKPPGQRPPWNLQPWVLPNSRRRSSFYGLSIIEIPMDPMDISLDVFFCPFRDGLGWLHKCNYEGSEFLQCEMAINYKKCPRGLK